MALPWDQRLANDSAMAEHCMKLGAVVIAPPKKSTGFMSAPPKPPKET